MKRLKEEVGIALITLVITVIVLFIIAGVSIMAGIGVVDNAKAETIETNMLTIKAKAKEYMENVDSKNWASNDSNENEDYGDLSTKEGKNRKEFTGDKYKLTLIENKTLYNNYANWYKDGYTYYELEKKALEKMDLPDLYEDGEVYIIRYPLEDGDTTDLKMDIIYAKGIEYQGVIYYELSELEKAL